MHRKHRRTCSGLCLTDLAVSYSFGPPMRSFSSFMSQKEARLKMKGYTSQSPSPRSERGEDPCCKGPAAIQSTCHCVGAHPGLLLCRNQSCSLWLPSAPEACGRPPCCFGFRYVVGQMRGPGYHHHWLWPFALSPQAQYHSVFFLIHSPLFTSQEHFQAYIPIVFSLFLLYSYSPFSFGVYAYCSLEHPHYTHGYILRASLFDFGLVGSKWWAGGSCRAGPALRAPQPTSRRVGLGVLLGWAPLQKHWCYCQCRGWM